MRDGLAAAWPVFYPGCRNPRDRTCVECRTTERMSALLCESCTRAVVRSSAAIVQDAVETRDRIAELRAARALTWKRPVVTIEPPEQLSLI